MKTSIVRSLKAGLLVVAMAATWILFAPTEFGGSATYVIVAGASMEPELRQGDLVIARQAARYDVGDVAAYMHPQVGLVIHRIIERRGPYYMFQGDHNEWVDSFEPTTVDILGKEWLRINGGAEFLVWLRKPLGLSLLSLAVGGMLLMVTSGGGKHKKNRGRRDAGMFSKWHRQFQSLRPMEWIFPLGILFFAAVVLGLVAFTRPRFDDVSMDLAYTHQGDFSYAGVGSPAVYDRGQIASGEAVFHALVNELALEFAYQFDSSLPADINGSYAVYVRISEPNGWQRTLELQPETVFEGDSFHMATTLDVDQITTIVERLRNRTEFTRQTFNVDLNVVIAVSGTLDGRPFMDSFTATLPFIMDSIELYVDTGDAADDSQNPLSIASTSYLSRTDTAPHQLSLLGVSLSVDQSRAMAVIVGVLSLALLAFILVPARALSKAHPAEGIKLSHADRLIDVTELPQEAGLAQVEVSSFDDLVKLSELSGGLILHHQQGSEHIYVVELGSTYYRFILQEAEETANDSETASPAEDEK